MRSFFNKIKQKVAAALVVVMSVQAALGSLPLGFGTAYAAAANRVNLTTAEPEQDAFTSLYVETGTTVGGDGDTLSMRFFFQLDDAWLEENLYEKVDSGILQDPGGYEGEGDYDAYLKGLNDETLPSLSFTCTVADGVLDVAEIQEYLSQNEKIYTTQNEEIGTWKVEDGASGPVFTITLDKKVYNRTHVTANRSLEAKLLERFEPGTSVDSGAGSGPVDLVINIKGSGTSVATNSDYVMEKSAEVGEDTRNAANEVDPSAINFTIAVKANASDALLGRPATDSGWVQTASPSVATGSSTVASASTVRDRDATDSDWDDDVPHDERDGDLLFDWWNFSVPVKPLSQGRRMAADAETVAVDGVDLAGKYIVDTISSKLNLDAVEISYDDGETWDRLDAETVTGSETWEAYLEANDRRFSYEIPASKDGDEVKTFSIRFYTRISDALWKDYAAKGALKEEFPNKAILKGENGDTTLTISNQVTPSIAWKNLIEKDGYPLDVNGDRYEWKIQVDAHFSDGVTLYLVDHIEDSGNTHEYSREKVLLESGSARKEFAVEELGENDLGTNVAKSFEQLTIDGIEALLGERFKDGTAYIYSYQGNDAGRTDQIMLIPMVGFTNGSSTITYETKIKEEQTEGQLGYQKTLKNEVKAVWKWDILGPDPGEHPFGSIVVQKDYPLQVNVVNKKGGAYDSTENTVTWEFDVNQRGVNLDSVLIEDALNREDSPALHWFELGAGHNIPLIRADRKPVLRNGSETERTITYVTPEEWKEKEHANQTGEADYYTVAGSKLSIRLGAMKAQDYYKFSVKTSVLEGNYAADGTWTVTNDAEVTATVNQQPSEPIAISASKDIRHSLISKYVEPFKDQDDQEYWYNYQDNTVKWRVKINPDSRTIKNAKLTDDLPLGTTFDKLISVKKGDQEYPINQGEWDADGKLSVVLGAETLTLKNESGTGSYQDPDATGPYSKDKVTITFPEKVKESYEFVFTTSVDENFRKEVVKSAYEATSEGKQGEPLCNQVELTGTIGGKNIVNAKAEATNWIHPQPLLKEGEYHGLSGYTYRDEDNPEGREIEAVWFAWTAYVNRTGVDMMGVTIWDTLEDCFELIPMSMNVDVVELDERGDVVGEHIKRIIEKGTVVTGVEPFDSWQVDAGGFSFQIPDEYKDSTLRLTFDTVLVDDAAASQMVNAIHAEGNDWKDSSYEVSDGSAKDFMLSDYAQAQGMIYLRVLKTSANKSIGKLYLKDAEFSLQKMELKTGEGSASIASWKPTGSPKKRKTRANGSLSFLFLQPDTLYKLEETNAPVGYRKEDKIWYIVAKLSEKSAGYFPEETQNAKAEIVINKDLKRNSLEHEVPNQPFVKSGTNELRFVKTGQNGQRLPGTKFQLKSSHQSWTETANEEGVVSFKNLDPLPEGQYYTLRETCPVGYTSPPLYYVSVSMDVAGAYTLKLLDRDKHEISDTMQDSEKENAQEHKIYEIKNTAIQTTGSFVKVDQNHEILKDEVTFAIYRRGDGGTRQPDGTYTVVMNPADKAYQAYLPSENNQVTSVTSENGKVTLNNLYYGYYKLVEQDPAADSNILKPQTPVSIYIKVDKNGIKALPMDTETPEEATDGQYTLKLDGKTGNDSLTVMNTLKWGCVQVKKVLGSYDSTNGIWKPEKKDGKAIPLAGVLFGVYVDSGSESEELYMRLKTGDDGTFLMDQTDKTRYQIFNEKGVQVGTKALLCGDYYLKELSAPDQYIKNEQKYNFTISAGEGADVNQYHPSTVVSINSESEQNVSPDTKPYFLNKLKRYPVKITKMDAEKPDLKLNHAQFHVFANEQGTEYVVAELNSTGTDGAYTLKPINPACAICGNVTEQEQNGNGERYLEKNPEKNPEQEEYLLLPGSYAIKETTAPHFMPNDNLYPKDETLFATLNVRLDGTVNLTDASGGSLNPSGTTVKNIVKYGSVKLNKSVMMWNGPDEGTGGYEYQPVSGFRFQLSGTTAHTPGIKKTWDSITDEQGSVHFEKIPVGTYQLKEMDIPSEYKVENDWLVHKMPDIWVEVTPEENETAANATITKYYTVNQDGTKGTELTSWSGDPLAPSQEQSSVYLQNEAGGNANASVIAYNALKLADAEGDKLAVAGFGEANEAALPGAEFTLTHQSLKTTDGEMVTFTAITDQEGKLSFSQIPYGSYTLEETKAPAGFKKMENLTFTITDQNASNSGGHFQDQENKTTLRNQLLLANARFQKIDQSGNAISTDKLDAKFMIEQVRSQVEGEDFWPEGGRTVSTDTEGYLRIDHLPCGIYKVTETLEPNQWKKLDQEATPVNFWLEVKAMDSRETMTVTAYGKDPSAQSAVGFLKSLLIQTDPLAAVIIEPNETADFTSQKGLTTGTFEAVAERMTNILRHGSIQVNKVGGDPVGENGHTVTTPLADVRFEICRQGEATPYLTLKTDQDGHFPEMGPGGTYVDAESGKPITLFAGEYTIKEIASVEGYKTCPDTASFTISDRGETVFIGYDGKEMAVVSSASSEDVKFYNVPERGKLEFEKKDSETGKSLDGAVFVACTDEAQQNPVAFISQIVKGGKYVIVGDEAQVSALKAQYPDVSQNWMQTIAGVAAVSGNAENGYALKAGKYYIKEIQAPEGYKIPADAANRIEVMVAADETVWVQSGTVAGDLEPGVVANAVVKTRLDFTKKIDTSDYRPADTAGGMTFLLKGTSANAITEEPWQKEATSGEDGKFFFADVPVGTYTLYECDRAQESKTDQYLGFAPGVADEVAVLRVSVTAENGEAEVAYTVVEESPVAVELTESPVLTNKLKLGSIIGRKVAEEGKRVGLKDAFICIFRTREDALNGSNPVTGVRSSDDGEFLFEQVPYGTYYIREQQAPHGYVQGTAIFQVTIQEAGLDAVTKGVNVEMEEDSAEMTDIVFVNGNRRGAVRLKKLAYPSEEPLKDAEFTVYARYTDGILKDPVAYLKYQETSGDYMLTDGDGLTGQATSLIPYLQKGEDGNDYLIQGHYWLAETAVPAGYWMETEGGAQKVYPVTISGDGSGQQLPTVEITNDSQGSAFYNDLMTGGFTINKTIEVARPGESEPDAPQAGEGFRFRIDGRTEEAAGRGTPISRIPTVRIDGGALEDAPNAVRDGDALIVTTGADGRVQITGLPIGAYTVTETGGPDIDLYTSVKAKEVVIGQNSSQTELEITFDGERADADGELLSFHNERKRYRVEGRKTDEKGAALAGVRFGLYSEDGQTFYRDAMTDDEGEFAFEQLITGAYVVKELSPSDEAYLVDDRAYPVVITSDLDPSEPVALTLEPIVNVLKRGFVEIEKTDPENRDYIFTEVQFTLYDKDGRRIADLKQEENRFTLASPSDGIYETDSKGDRYLVWDDRVQKTALIYGDYYIQETRPEPGYLADLDSEGNLVKHKFSVVEDTKTVIVSNDGAERFENWRARGRLTLEKEKEIVNANIFAKEGDTVPGEGFTFRISYQDTTAGQQFGDADIREFAVVEHAGRTEPGQGGDMWLDVTTGADGSVVLSDLLAGEYTITEISRAHEMDAYVLPASQTVTVEVNQRDNAVTKEQVAFVNRLKRSRIEGLKTDASNRPLAGAVMGLFPSDTVEFTEENLFWGRQAISGEDGVFAFEHIPYGTYRIAELAAPSGYRLNTRTSYLVTVSEDGASVGAGIQEDNGSAAGSEAEAIVITNTRNSGGGGGGGGGGNNRPRPGNPTDPTSPGPGVETVGATEAVAPAETTIPADSVIPADPAGSTIPFDPENPVIDIPGNPPRVEIMDENDHMVYEGPGSRINIGDWEAGLYTVYTFDDQDVPMGTMTFTIGEDGVPLAFVLPKTGDASLPYALLAAIMLGALAGMATLVSRRRKER